MKPWNFYLISCFFLLFIFSDVRAEGRCPPGQYPVGGQGVQGCAPIPGYGAHGGNGGHAAPVPSGEWLKTWGAIAGSPSTNLMGVSVGEISKEEAERVALAKCAAEGDRNCKINLSYHNQCVAYVVPSSGKGVPYVVSAPTEAEALGDAILSCSDTGGGRCIRFYSECSKPIFIPY
jgi:hypothetical protein